MDYPLLVTVAPLEEGGFLAVCPQIEGCHAEGATIGQAIDKHKVILDEPIKHLGTYKVPIKVGELEPAVTVIVQDETGVIPTPETPVAVG